MVGEHLSPSGPTSPAPVVPQCGGMILRGPGPKRRCLQPARRSSMTCWANGVSRWLPRLSLHEHRRGPLRSLGGEVDWLHQSRGIWTFTNKLFTPFNFNRTSNHEGFFGSDELRHTFDKYLLLGEGVVPWREVEHPQYGKVEDQQ